MYMRAHTSIHRRLAMLCTVMVLNIAMRMVMSCHVMPCHWHVTSRHVMTCRAMYVFLPEFAEGLRFATVGLDARIGGVGDS